MRKRALAILRAAPKYVLIVLAALVALYLGAVFFTSHDYGIRLPGEYELVHFYSGGNAIVEGLSDIVVGMNVDRYDVVDYLVVGHVSAQTVSYAPEPEVPGYFIVDTKNGKIDKGMTRGEYTAALRDHGIANSPKLKRGNKIRAYLSRL